jgi:hypothetical protein
VGSDAERRHGLAVASTSKVPTSVKWAARNS